MSAAATLFRCCGPSCPGLPFRASDIAHPPTCNAPAGLTAEDLDALRGLCRARAEQFAQIAIVADEKIVKREHAERAAALWNEIARKLDVMRARA